MSTNTILIAVIVGAVVVGVLAWSSYEQTQNSLGTQLGFAAGGLLKGLF